MPDRATLTGVDYIVASTILLVPMAIGIRYAVKDANKATRAEYLLGGRQMTVLPVSLSLFITYVSAVSLMGLPAEAFFFGVIIFMSSFGMALAYVFGYFTVVPLMYPLHLTSIYHYLKLRYKSEAVRQFSTVVGMLTTICYMAVTLLSPALALQACASVPLWVSIALLGTIGTLYTALGGFKSVVWTDVFQTTVVVFGLIVIIVKVCIDLGGIGEVWRLSEAGGRTRFDKFSLDPRVRHTQWSLLIGFFWIWLINSFSQSTLQRISCMKGLRDARVAYVINGPFMILYHVITLLVGLAIFAYYTANGCDPYESGMISNRNQLAPYFVLHAMADLPGMAGLFTGILCCGCLSTLSSGINALAANTVEDILSRPLRSLEESTITLITKLTVVVYGGLIIGLTYLVKSMQGPVTQISLSIFGAFSSPILGIFLMGGAVPWANKFGALAGAITSLIFNV